MVVTYYMQYIKLYRMGADRHNSILLSLLRLVAETNKTEISPYYLRPQNKNLIVMGPLSKLDDNRRGPTAKRSPSRS